jgi:hypothetical protein
LVSKSWFQGPWGSHDTSYIPSERTPKKIPPHCCASAQQQDQSENTTGLFSLPSNSPRTDLKENAWCYLDVAKQLPQNGPQRKRHICPPMGPWNGPQSQSHFTTDDQSVSKSWFHGPWGSHDQILISVDIYEYCFIDYGCPLWQEVGSVTCRSHYPSFVSKYIQIYM